MGQNKNKTKKKEQIHMFHMESIFKNFMNEKKLELFMNEIIAYHLTFV